MGGLLCPFCLRRHPPGWQFDECQYERCREPPSNGLCVCKRCFVQDLHAQSEGEGEGQYYPTARSLVGLNPGVPLDYARPPARPVSPSVEARPRPPDFPRQLVEAIVARPEDDAPRSALANHLRDLGDAQGELIALQLHSARYLVAPLSADAIREKKLLARRGEWLPQGVAEKSSVFARGLLRSCVLEGATDPRHRAWVAVETLDCWGGEPPAELLRTGLPLLRELTNAGAQAFEAMGPRPRLELLDLTMSATELGTAVALFERFPALSTLGLCEADPSTAELETLIRNFGERGKCLRLKASAVNLSWALDFVAREAPDLKLCLRVARHRTPTWIEAHRGHVRVRAASTGRWLEDFSYATVKTGEAGLRQIEVDCDGKVTLFPR